jgi:hypothetical protein
MLNNSRNRNPKLTKITTDGARDPTFPQFFEVDHHPLIDNANGRILIYKVDTSFEASKARYELGQSRKIPLGAEDADELPGQNECNHETQSIKCGKYCRSLSHETRRRMDHTRCE